MEANGVRRLGYRLRPGVTTIVTHGGEWLPIIRDGKSDLVLTIDDAATGAGLINAMRGGARE
jgi:hypothetical protein